jgi:hypothetical protein
MADSKKSRRSLRAGVANLLWGRAAGRCEFEGCARQLTRESITKRDGNYADRAHILPIGECGPRATSGTPATTINSIDNLMLVCHEHHVLIDRHPAEYPEDRLLAMKREHEDRVRRATDFTVRSPSHVLVVRGRIGGDRAPTLSREDIWQVLDADRYYSATDSPIEVDVSDLGYTDADEDFWAACETTLRRKLESAFEPYGSLHRAEHISVFALAPIPVLMILGKILGDVRPASVHQLDRYAGSWGWPIDESAGNTEFSFAWRSNCEEGISRVALTISLSAAIDRSLVVRAMGNSAFAEVSFTTPRPGFSTIRHPADLKAFRKAMHDCLGEIETRFGSACEIHVFPAIPASTAVEFGRLLLPKAYPGILIYDHHRDRDGFHQTLWLCTRSPSEARTPNDKEAA